MAAEGDDAPGAIAQILADALVDAPGDDEEPPGRRAPTSPTEEDDDDLEVALTGVEPGDGQEPARTAREENREIFGENRRRLAAAVLANLPGFSCVTMSSTLAIVGAGLWVYHDAFTAYDQYKFREGTCDQPLAEWLIVAVIILPVQVCCVIVYRKLRAMRPPRSRRRRRNPPTIPRYVWLLGAVLRLWLLLVNPLFLFLGYYYLSAARFTGLCDADLMDAASEFMVFEACVVIASAIIVYCFAPVVLAAHANGRVAQRRQSRQGTAQPVRRVRTAQPGAIDRIETVPYSAELFSETGGDQEPPECCICQMEFDEDNPIKRTPCKHYFHESCLADWIGNYSKTCPLCRLDLDIQGDTAG